MYKSKPKKYIQVRKRQKRNMILRWYKHHRGWVHIFLLITGILVLLIITGISIKTFIFAEKYNISEIAYSKESKQIYNYPALYQDIGESFLNKNYNWTKRFYLKKITKHLQEKHPIIEKLEMKFVRKNIIEINILFHSPTLIFRTPSQRIAVYSHTFYPLGEKDLLGSGSRQIDLPRYTSGFNNLHGILYKISETKLATMTESIYETLGRENIYEFIYLPGGQLIFLNYKGKRVIINLEQDIDNQLIKLIDLENRYPGFKNIYKIDIGSSNDIIIK